MKKNISFAVLFIKNANCLAKSRTPARTDKNTSMGPIPVQAKVKGVSKFLMMTRLESS